MGARRCDAQRGRLPHGGDESFQKTLPFPRYLHIDHIARHGVRHKQYLVVYIRDGFAFGGNLFNLDLFQ